MYNMPLEDSFSRPVALCLSVFYCDFEFVRLLLWLYVCQFSTVALCLSVSLILWLCVCQSSTVALLCFVFVSQPSTVALCLSVSLLLWLCVCQPSTVALCLSVFCVACAVWQPVLAASP